MKRVEEMITFWSQSLQLSEEDVQNLRQEEGESKVLFYLRSKPVRFEISVKNQQLQVNPPLAKARVVLNGDLQSWLSCICNIKRCKTFLAGSDDGEEDFRYILKTIKPEVLVEAYTQIENLMRRTQVKHNFEKI